MIAKFVTRNAHSFFCLGFPFFAVCSDYSCILPVYYYYYYYHSSL